MKGEIENVTPLSHRWELSEIADQRIVEAMRKVPRHLFVPEDFAAKAHEDRALPIGRGQTTSEPIVVATMTEALSPQETDRVLEVGAGSGYQTAVLAELVQTVYAVEIDPSLAGEARERLLEKLHYRNIILRNADGYDGWIEEAPFDSILVTAAAQDIPPALLDQLKNGGRMVIPVGTPAGPQELMLVKKNGKTVTTRTLMPTRFVSIQRE